MLLQFCVILAIYGLFCYISIAILCYCFYTCVAYLIIILIIYVLISYYYCTVCVVILCPFLTYMRMRTNVFFYIFIAISCYPLLYLFLF